MIVMRKSEERGQANHGWLQSRFSFSFAEYYDPRHMGFGPLRVINDDWIAAGMGFGTHPHKDMEIITYVLEGEIAHKDSMGNGSTIRPGDVQRMTAGTGVRHSEFNPSPVNKTHLLQIWIMPDRLNLEPGYEEKRFSSEDKRGRLRVVAAPDAREGAVKIHQDATLSVGLFDGAESAEHPLTPNRLCYVHLARGELEVNGHSLKAGDALLMQAEASLHLHSGKQAEVLVFDLPR
ncbi:pirin family protein [Undibacterium sp. LX40W]|uniref:Pirin family protein n=1 Tax=Undibacterium nitidum TaxID=2762298 RepID=A0A923KKZ1_9BURK|nr:MULTISPECIES: pirin family protein [Undibacterium]MBC3881265.1 pirin family protein [Undibacterium nitidum]MBC3891952.1 pirin family protein [Undibacterium sp. LX40W]